MVTCRMELGRRGGVFCSQSCRVPSAPANLLSYVWRNIMFGGFIRFGGIVTELPLTELMCDVLLGWPEYGMYG